MRHPLGTGSALVNLSKFLKTFLFLAFLGWVGSSGKVDAQVDYPRIFPEQRELEVRQIDSLPQYDVYRESYTDQSPETVLNETRNRVQDGDDKIVEPLYLTLDQAIEIALQNSEVVRVLGGLSALSSGRTIYDAAITNTSIDANQALFDPNFFTNNGYDRVETPTGVLASLAQGTSRINGLSTGGFRSRTGITKESVYGTTGSLTVDANQNRLKPGIFALNPRVRSVLEFSLTQSLLRGADPEANYAPIMISRINTERSYFQYKNSVQNLVRGVIEGYWQLVFARLDLWVRERQLELSGEDLKRAQARRKRQFANLADLSQRQVSYLNFKANYTQAKATLLQRESALRNLLGLAPEDGKEIVPTSELARKRLPLEWEELLLLAETNRPDIVELKLVIEADEQLLIQNENQALPSLDAVANYRWNGLSGEMPNGTDISTNFGEYTDWTLGVNFSVPLGLRQARAGVRQQQLIVARDKANLKQGLHAVVHELATTIRTLDQNFALYEVYRESVPQAKFNLRAQDASYRNGRTIFLSVLQAINDWGNTISNEASALTQYNIALADLERSTGTILESHGIRFVEERFGALGPLGRWSEPLFYPYAHPPESNQYRYPDTGIRAEEQFNLQDYSNFSSDSTPPLIQPIPRRNPSSRKQQ